MYRASSHFSHPVPLGTPSLDYGRMEVDEDQLGVTQKGSIWNPQGRDTFKAFWAQDNWTVERILSRATELNRYKDATVKTFPYTVQGMQDALKYARALTGKSATNPVPMPGTPQSPTAAPSYAPAPGTAPGTQPPAAPGGSLTDQPWFWPAAIGGGIALIALAWAFTPASAGPKVVIRKAASRFTGF